MVWNQMEIFFFRRKSLHKWPALVVLYEKASSMLSERGTWKHEPVKYAVAHITLNYSLHLQYNAMNGATSADVLYVNVLMFLYHALVLL